MRKTVFVTPDGCYEFLRTPFGMKNSGATLVRGMRELLSGMDNVGNYIDYLIAYTKGWESRLATLKELFNRLQEASFTARVVRRLWTFLDTQSVKIELPLTMRTWRRFAFH